MTKKLNEKITNASQNQLAEIIKENMNLPIDFNDEVIISCLAESHKHGYKHHINGIQERFLISCKDIYSDFCMKLGLIVKQYKEDGISKEYLLESFGQQKDSPKVGLLSSYLYDQIIYQIEKYYGSD